MHIFIVVVYNLRSTRDKPLAYHESSSLIGFGPRQKAVESLLLKEIDPVFNTF
jgi:hypothetical protein